MIRVDDIAKRYGSVEALKGIDLEVQEGETFGIIGPNGAGKTTLLKILLGLVRPDRGSVTVDQFDLKDHPEDARRRIGYVPQRAGFEDGTAARDALHFLARLRGSDPTELEPHAREAHVDHLLDRRVGTLSGGERQRLSLAAALLGDPPVLLLDEPTASLDPKATADFRALVRKLGHEGRTILLSSHLLTDVERLCDRVLVLLDGEVASLEATANPVGVLVVRLEKTARATEILESLPGRFRWIEEGCLEVELSLPEDQLQLLNALQEAEVGLKSFETRYPTLEERFLATVGGAGGGSDDVPS